MALLNYLETVAFRVDDMARIHARKNLGHVVEVGKDLPHFIGIRGDQQVRFDHERRAILLDMPDRREREVEADAMTFGMLFHYWLAPYWSCKAGVNAQELLGYGELSQVLPAVSSKVELVIARNDPLNDEGAADELRSIKTEAKVTVLPSGGHAGFVRTTQMKSIVNRIFAESVAQVSSRR